MSFWIKVESNLASKLEVMAMARRMGVSSFEVVGMCVAFWGWADGQTIKGDLRFITHDDIDRVVGVVGFAKHLEDVGWLVVDDAGAIIPNFERHNGKSAKRRAMNARRIAIKRNEEGGNK